MPAAKRTVSLAPITVSEGAYEYSEGGLTLEGHRIAQTQYLQQLFNNSPYPAGPYHETYTRARETKLSDHRWLRVQLIFYGIDFESGNSALTIPVEDLRDALREAVEAGECAESAPAVRELEHKLKRRFRRAQIRQLEDSIARFQNNSGGKRQLEQRLLDLQRLVLKEQKQSHREGLTYVSSDSEEADEDDDDDDPLANQAASLQRPLQRKRRNPDEDEDFEQARIVALNRKIITRSKRKVEKWRKTSAPTSGEEDGSDQFMTPEPESAETQGERLSSRPRQASGTSPLNEEGSDFLGSVVPSTESRLANLARAREVWSQPHISSQPTTVSVTSRNSTAISTPLARLSGRNPRNRNMLPPPPRVVIPTRQKTNLPAHPTLEHVVRQSTNTSPVIKQDPSAPQHANPRATPFSASTDRNPPSWLDLDSHTAEANHDPEAFISKHFLDRDGEPDRLKTLIPIVMHGIKDPGLLGLKARQVGLVTDTYYLGGQEREANALFVVGWSEHVVSATVRLLGEVEKGEGEGD